MLLVCITISSIILIGLFFVGLRRTLLPYKIHAKYISKSIPFIRLSSIKLTNCVMNIRWQKRKVTLFCNVTFYQHRLDVKVSLKKKLFEFELVLDMYVIQELYIIFIATLNSLHKFM